MSLLFEWSLSSQYHYLVKHTGHENEKNDHKRKDDLIFMQILPSSTIKHIKNSEEKMHADIGAWRVNISFDISLENLLLHQKNIA